MDFNWSKSEKELVKKLFDLAKQKDYENLYKKINSIVVKTPEDVWSLQDFLNEKSKEFDEKYDYRYSQLIFVFSRFINEKLLTLTQLEGLSIEKIDFIKRITSLK